MKVQFVRDELYENLGRNKGTQYLQNSIHDFTPEFAERWIRRGAAKVVTEDDAKAAESARTEVKVPVKGNLSTGGPIKPPVDDQSIATKAETADKQISKDKEPVTSVTISPLPLKK